MNEQDLLSPAALNPQRLSYRACFDNDMAVVRAEYDPEWQRPEILDTRFADIRNRAANVTSQFGEDGLIAAIFEKIGVKYHACFEVGAVDGEFFSNTKALRDKGWYAALGEGNHEDFVALTQIEGERTRAIEAIVDIRGRGLDYWFADYFKGCDLGVIDIDGDDVAAFARMHALRPRVMVMEYGERLAKNYDSQILFACTVAVAKRYTPVAATFCNLICVADEEIP